jgi:hypothetical protein
MARALSISNKTATLSSRFTGSKMRSADEEGEEGGDAGQFEPGRKYKFSEIRVNESFAQEVAQHPGIWNFLFDFGPDKKSKGPASERVGPIRIKEKFKGCKVKIAWGISNEVEVLNARVGGIRLESVGTECHMTCDIQGLFPMTLATLKLEERQGEQVRLWIKFGSVDAGDEAGEGEQADFVDEQNEDEAAEEPAKPPKPKKGEAGVTH